jgi:hypothetical protein
MTLTSIILTISGLVLFEVVSSIDNAIINAEVLSTMSQRAKKWFLLWGLFFAVFVVRGLLPWLIVWVATPELGPIEAFTATFSSDPRVIEAVEKSSPMLLLGGGIFLVFLFFHWLFLEPKNYGLKGERFFHAQGIWFFAVVSLILSTVVWFALKQDPIMAFGAVVGSTAFFIMHGFKENAESSERKLLENKLNSIHILDNNKIGKSDLSKIFFLEVIDMTFSIDGVLGAFAFTLSVPLILIGNGIGAIVLRKLTMGNIERIKKYIFLKNGAMYSIFFLGGIMILDSFHIEIPSWVSPVITFGVVLYFFFKSKMHLDKNCV